MDLWTQSPTGVYGLRFDELKLHNQNWIMIIFVKIIFKIYVLSNMTRSN